MRQSQPLARTILFVDDDLSILGVRRLLFETLGYLVVTAASGEEALDLMQDQAVDAVVLDYLMPTMDGQETAQRMRDEHGNVPIVLSSGLLSVPESLRGIVDVSVDKGTRPEELIHAIAKVLERGRDTGDGQPQAKFFD